MLSLIACCSFIPCAGWLVFSLLPSSRVSILAKRLPKLSPTLRVWAVIIVILAIDFAINSLGRWPSGIVLRLDACDAALVLLSAIQMMFFSTSLRDLWAFGFSVGLICFASMPTYAVR